MTISIKQTADVYKTLITPIKVNKQCNDIHRADCGMIISGQSYYSTEDEDMSNFSVGFYEIIYKEILDNASVGSILNTDGGFISNDFAGDTMNSFNTTANRTPCAGISIKSRTNQCIWPKYLREYYHGYHCLANFWIIPMSVGRMSKKAGNDYMDTYLKHVLKFDFNNPPVGYGLYLKSFSDFNSFCEKHFLHGYFENKAIRLYSSNKDAESVIANMTDRMKIRARDISKSKYANELWHYFKKFSLV